MTFGDDLRFLKAHKEVIVLKSQDGQAQVAVVPDWQGRVATSTAAGENGISFGWLNRKLIASGEIQEHINVFGGEDRFWLGPEGGQYSIFFKKGDPFDLDHWYVPAVIDTEPFELVRADDRSIVFRKEFELTNYAGFTFRGRVDRTIRLLDRADVVRQLGIEPGADVSLVAYESENTLTNIGREAWKKDTGLLSIWILGMFTPSPQTTVVIPFNPGPVEELGAVVNDAYFGKVPPERLVVQDSVLFFKGDGRYRSKIGVSPRRCKPVLGSYDAGSRALTVVQFNFPEGATDYVNSMWEWQENPYGGDVVNSYNDGPASPGAEPFGPFYELETSSPAAALAPGESITHVHRTIHLVGPEEQLDLVAQWVLGVHLEQVKDAFPR